MSINVRGEITGFYFANGAHGFLRDRHGVITAFDVPGTLGRTVVVGINARAQIAGNYFPNGGGFVREKNGGIRTLEVPGATNTVVRGITDRGEIVGNYDADNRTQSFLRDEDGVIITFDGVAGSIKNRGDILSAGFLRDEDGTFTTIDGPPGANFAGSFARYRAALFTTKLLLYFKSYLGLISSGANLLRRPQLLR